MFSLCKREEMYVCITLEDSEKIEKERDFKGLSRRSRREGKKRKKGKMRINVLRYLAKVRTELETNPRRFI